MIKTNIPEINVDELMEKIKAEVRRRKEREETVHGPAHQAGRASQPAPSPRIDPLNIGTIPEPESFELKEGGYHINDFLKYHDLHFVMNAYRGILRRRPDSEGLQHFLKNLRSGKMTKAEVLGRLRYAPEGRAKKVKIRGLFWNFVVQSSFRIPVLGYFSRLTVGLVNLPVIIRNLNTLEANTFAQLQAQHNHINTLAETAQFKINELIDKHGQVGPVLDQKADRDELAELNEKKVSCEELIELNEAKADVKDLMALNDKKADRDELGQLKEEVEGVLERKADKLELSELGDRKADRDELGQLKEEVEGVLERKADKLELSELGDQKADRDELGQLKEEVEGVLDQKADKEQIEPIKNETSEILRQTRDNKLNILDQQRRLALLLEEARKRLPEPISTDQIKKMLTEEDHLLDAMYVSFEDQFRGSRQEIKEKLKVYLPYLQKVNAGTKETPILDVGCGRGEWLELCKENGLFAKGIEINQVLISQCLESELSVVQGDALTYLRAQKNACLAAVTGFHLVEHLSLKKMIVLFDECYRVLRPGGIVIFETPNPENLVTAACNFYLDPTHRNPLPPPLLEFLLEERGFVRLEVKRLHPSEYFASLQKNGVNEKIAELFASAMDYGVIGYKS